METIKITAFLLNISQSTLFFSVCLRLGVALQQQPAEFLGVRDRKRTGEVLADVGCGDTALLDHGGEDGKTLAQETVSVIVNEHQDLPERKGGTKEGNNAKFTKFIFLFWLIDYHLKGRVYPKMEIQSLFTYTHARGSFLAHNTLLEFHRKQALQ